jgi:hypothetical protein
MNAAARKAYERHARLNRWAAWAGAAIMTLAVTASASVLLGAGWLTVSLLFTI